MKHEGLLSGYQSPREVGGPTSTLETPSGSEGRWGLASPGAGGPGWHCLVSPLFSKPFLYSALN